MVFQTRRFFVHFYLILFNIIILKNKMRIKYFNYVFLEFFYEIRTLFQIIKCYGKQRLENKLIYR